MAMWQVPPAHLAAEPPVVEVTASGVWPLELDLARYLGAGEAAKRCRATLTNLASGESRDVRSFVRGATLVAVVGNLEPGRDYRLVWTWVVSAIKQPSRITIVRCVA